MKDNELHAATIAVFAAYLSNLSRIMRKAKRVASKKKVSEHALLNARLAPDMFTFTQQIGYAYFTALETTTNLSGKTGPELGYDEKSFKELEKSLEKVISFLKKCSKKDFKGASKKRITSFLDPKNKYAAEHYVLYMALPNFFFHVTTAYDILRHKGIPLGKDDYLGM